MESGARGKHLRRALAKHNEVAYIACVQRALYFKLAEYDPQLQTWRDGRRAYANPSDARADATAAGRYRISMVTPQGREDGEPFDVAGPAQAPKPKPTRGGLRKHPGPWHTYGG